MKAIVYIVAIGLFSWFVAPEILKQEAEFSRQYKVFNVVSNTNK